MLISCWSTTVLNCSHCAIPLESKLIQVWFDDAWFSMHLIADRKKIVSISFCNESVYRNALTLFILPVFQNPYSYCLSGCIYFSTITLSLRNPKVDSFVFLHNLQDGKIHLKWFFSQNQSNIYSIFSNVVQVKNDRFFIAEFRC